MVDGGTGYLKRNVNNAPFEELSIYSDAPHDDIRPLYFLLFITKERNMTVKKSQTSRKGMGFCNPT
jgi:hypothetical protein